MLRQLLVGIAAALVLQSGGAAARGGHSSHRSSSQSTTSTTRSSSHRTRSSATRSNSYHRSKRDPAQRRAFQHASPCPANVHRSGACPGYWVDHVIPLKRGGADRLWNMQWQTIAEATAQDK